MCCSMSYEIEWSMYLLVSNVCMRAHVGDQHVAGKADTGGEAPSQFLS